MYKYYNYLTAHAPGKHSSGESLTNWYMSEREFGVMCGPNAHLYCLFRILLVLPSICHILIKIGSRIFVLRKYHVGGLPALWGEKIEYTVHSIE